MRLVTFTEKSSTSPHVGVLVDDDAVVLDLTTASGLSPVFASMRSLIAGGDVALERAREFVDAPPSSSLHLIATTKFRAPIPNPIRMRDCTLFIAHLEPAFRALARQQALDAPNPDQEYDRLIATGSYDLPQVLRDQPVYYNADHLSVSGPDDLITAPAASSKLDYELEIGVVLGRTGRDVTEVEAPAYIFGYTVYNDWSLRDVQSIVMKSNLGPAEGKDFDGGTTLGPCLVTADELSNPYRLEMVARVNGEEWSRGNSSTMQHSFESLVAQLSRGKTVYAGEVLGSGTVLSGSGFEIGRTLQDGDTVELEIEQIGVLRNRIRYTSAS